MEHRCPRSGPDHAMKPVTSRLIILSIKPMHAAGIQASNLSSFAILSFPFSWLCLRPSFLSLSWDCLYCLPSSPNSLQASPTAPRRSVVLTLEDGLSLRCVHPVIGAIVSRPDGRFQPWITPSLFDNTGNSAIVDEVNFHSSHT